MPVSASRSWGLVLLRGVLSVIFGCLAFIHPVSTAAALVWIFGIYAIIDGITALISAFHLSTHNDRWWGLILHGVFGILIGLIAEIFPVSVAAVLIYFVAAWALLTGISEIVAAVRLRREIAGEIWLILSGALSVLLGLVLFASPLLGVVVWVWVLGAYALLYGVSLIILSLKLKSHPAAAVTGDIRV